MRSTCIQRHIKKLKQQTTPVERIGDQPGWINVSLEDQSSCRVEYFPLPELFSANDMIFSKP